MKVVGVVTLAMLSMGGLLCLLRLVRGISVPDRIVALDALLVTIVSGIAVVAALFDRADLLDAMIVAALLGFTGTVTVGRYIEQRGSR